jgi:2-keto-4-pentenoate hydratase/2-oxohepta-3-ene-1,7-dioic acid hydratase in catechol pathway
MIVIVAGLAILLGAALLGAGLYFSAPVFDESVSAPPDGAFDILPGSQALTFARTKDGRPLLVSSADGDVVEAIDLGVALDTVATDPLAILRTHGYQRLATMVTGLAQPVPLEELGMPFDPSYPHIAAGTNFRAHAEEVGLDEGPFLFPKLTRASAWDAGVPARTRLDYEVELCAVTLGVYSADGPAPLGFVLCNDFTDRWALLTEIDLDAPMGQSGFPDAKGGAGMLPIGPFLLVPSRDAEFHRRLEIGLAVNDRLRQRDSAGLMIWSPHEIVRYALENCETPFVSAAGSHRLTPCDAVPEATLILTGTPAGVAFHFLNIWRPGSYLRPGDRVLAYGSHLGVLRNTIE